MNQILSLTGLSGARSYVTHIFKIAINFNSAVTKFFVTVWRNPVSTNHIFVKIQGIVHPYCGNIWHIFFLLNNSTVE